MWWPRWAFRPTSHLPSRGLYTGHRTLKTLDLTQDASASLPFPPIPFWTPFPILPTHADPSWVKAQVQSLPREHSPADYSLLWTHTCLPIHRVAKSSSNAPSHRPHVGPLAALCSRQPGGQATTTAFCRARCPGEAWPQVLL